MPSLEVRMGEHMLNDFGWCFRFNPRRSPSDDVSGCNSVSNSVQYTTDKHLIGGATVAYVQYISVPRCCYCNVY